MYYSFARIVVTINIFVGHVSIAFAYLVYAIYISAHTFVIINAPRSPVNFV